jgi:hypothetical protein
LIIFIYNFCLLFNFKFIFIFIFYFTICVLSKGSFPFTDHILGPDLGQVTLPHPLRHQASGQLPLGKRRWSNCCSERKWFPLLLRNRLPGVPGVAGAGARQSESRVRPSPPLLFIFSQLKYNFNSLFTSILIWKIKN